MALDAGIAERDYWEMTIAELIRAMESKNRIEKARAQEKAAYDYILADIIGRSISRLYASSNHYPHIADVYTTLFDKQALEDKEQERRAELSVMRFKQFAELHNKGMVNKIG